MEKRPLVCEDAPQKRSATSSRFIAAELAHLSNDSTLFFALLVRDVLVYMTQFVVHGCTYISNPAALRCVASVTADTLLEDTAQCANRCYLSPLGLSVICFHQPAYSFNECAKTICRVFTDAASYASFVDVELARFAWDGSPSLPDAVLVSRASGSLCVYPIHGGAVKRICADTGDVLASGELLAEGRAVSCSMSRDGTRIFTAAAQDAYSFCILSEHSASTLAPIRSSRGTVRSDFCAWPDGFILSEQRTSRIKRFRLVDSSGICSDDACSFLDCPFSESPHYSHRLLFVDHRGRLYAAGWPEQRGDKRFAPIFVFDSTGLFHTLEIEVGTGMVEIACGTPAPDVLNVMVQMYDGTSFMRFEVM
jgi:hypothetical protein